MKVIDRNNRSRTTNITFRLSPKVFKAIAELAKKHEVSRQLILNKILEKCIDSGEFFIEI